MKQSAVLVLLVIAVSSAVAAPRPRAYPKRAGGPILEFTATSVEVREATANAPLYLASVSLTSGYYTVEVEKSASHVVADSTGIARLEVENGISTRSVWIAVDGTSGGFTVAAPRGMLLREIDFPGRGVTQGADGVLRHLVFDRLRIHAFVIRPSGGVWRAYLRDGSAADEDKTRNGETKVNVAQFHPAVDGTAPLERIMPGDVVFVVDPESLEFAVLKRGN